MSFELASIPATQLESLIKLLLAACAVISKGSTSKDLKTLATSVVSGAKRAEQTMVVEITPLLMDIVKGNEVNEDDLKARAKELRAGIREEVRSDRKFDHETLDLLKFTSAYLINNGEPALRKMRMLVNKMDAPVLTQALAPEAKSQKDFAKPLEKIVQSVGKRKGVILTSEEEQRLKSRNRDVFREYKRLRNQYNMVWKDEMASYIVKSRKKAVPYKDLLAYLNSHKIDHPLTEGFTGLIDANGAIYTTAGKAILGGIPLKNSGFTIKMNPNYDPRTDDQFVFNTVKDGKVSQHVYTKNYRSQKNVQKFQAVSDLTKIIDKVHTTWIPFVRRGDLSEQCVAATVLEVMYQFSARIGNKDNATESDTGKMQKTYGISTLEARHVKIQGNRVTIVYPGKDAVRQVHVIDAGGGPEAKMLVRNLTLFSKGKQPKDRIFQFEDAQGHMKPIKSGRVNAMFKRLGSPVTAHKLRHVKGTQLFLEQMQKHANAIKPGMSQGDADRLFKQMATQVGALLGHVRGVGKQQKVTPATAIGNYIDPGVMLSYYERLQLRPPRGLAKLQSKDK